MGEIENKKAAISTYFKKLLANNKTIFGKPKPEVINRIKIWLNNNPNSVITYKIKNKLQIEINELPTDLNIQTLADIYTIYPELLDYPFKEVINGLQNEDSDIKTQVKAKFKLELEKRLEQVFRNSCESNPFANSQLEAMHSYTAILETSQTFKRDAIKFKEALRISETEVEEIVNEVTTKVFKKYFENFDET